MWLYSLRAHFQTATAGGRRKRKVGWKDFKICQFSHLYTPEVGVNARSTISFWHNSPKSDVGMVRERGISEVVCPSDKSFFLDTCWPHEPPGGDFDVMEYWILRVIWAAVWLKQSFSMHNHYKTKKKKLDYFLTITNILTNGRSVWAISFRIRSSLKNCQSWETRNLWQTSTAVYILMLCF